MIGELIGGRYEIIEKLGEGGMANVYKAKCRILKRYISIKILKNKFINDEEFVCKFKGEAMEVAKLSNNNIVSVYDIGTEGDIHYIVMEYINGKTLKDHINEDGGFSIKTAIDFGIQICNALASAHDIKLIHRDVKSQNILVSNSGIIKVTDFGIAKSPDSATITNSGRVLGSAYYISPEQAKGDIVDCRSDIYSLGVVLYEMFTGRLPFMQGTLVNVALQHIQVEPTEPIEINNKLPVGINNLIIKCLQKDPILRYQSVVDIKNDLIAIQNNKKYYVSKYNSNDSNTFMNSIKKDYMMRKNRKNVFKFTFIALAFLLFVGLSSYFIFSNAPGIFKSNVEVPSIIGKLDEDYKKELDKLGLKYELSGYVESDLEKNFVVDTLPKPGKVLKKGDTVKVVLSKGIEKVIVPNLVNKTLDESRIALENSNLKLGKVEERFSEIYDVGKIIVQNPNYNSEVHKNEFVDVVVSKGSESRFITVPDFIGLDVVEAENLAALEGIQIKLVPIESSVKSDNNKIFDQSVPKGIEVKVNIVIELSYYKYVENKIENDKNDDKMNNDKNDDKINNDKNNNDSLNNKEDTLPNSKGDSNKIVTIPPVDGLFVKEVREIFNGLGLKLDENNFTDDQIVKEIDHMVGDQVSMGSKIKIVSVY